MTQTALQQHNLTPEIREFWTSAQRQGHSLHEISYRACFKAELPEYFIERYTQAGDLVIDPFLGRGTTALQANLMGRVGGGSDINPLSIMLLRPRLNPPTSADIQTRLAQIPFEAEIPESDLELTVFYHPDTLASLIALKQWFANRERAGVFDHIDDWIRMVSLNRLSGHSSGFFSVRTLPPNQAVSIESQRKINIKNHQLPQPKNIAHLIAKKSKSLLRSAIPKNLGFANPLAVTDSRNLGYLDDGTISLIVTSPPFLDVVDYKKDNWLRCWFAGISLDSICISTYRRVEDWREFIRESIAEMCSKLKHGGYIAFEVGEIRNKTLCLEDEVTDAVQDLPVDIKSIMINQQEFTKTSNIWGTKNNIAGTNSNRIVLLQKS